MAIALSLGMRAKHIGELIAWQLAVAFRDEVYRLIENSPSAKRDRRFVDQLRNAISSTEANITEGFHRKSDGQFRQFLSYARASHAEAEARLRDGIARHYWREVECEVALRFAKRCGMATLRLMQSLEPAEPRPSTRRTR